MSSVPESTKKEREPQHVEVYPGYDEIDMAGPWKTLWRNPKIVLLSLFANVGALMYGYDNLALSLCLSMFPFQEQFGEPAMLATGPGFIIPAYWQSLWGAMAQVATALGALFIALVSDLFGRRYAFTLAGIVSAAGIAILFTASTPGVFLAGKIVNGLSLGMALATGQTYISEIAPLKIRGILLSGYAFCLNLGLLIAAAVAFSRITIMTSSSYKVLFAAGWVWAGLLITLSLLIPESPMHLIRKGQNDSARKSFARLHSSKADVAAILNQAIQTDAEEKEMAHRAKDTTYVECFRRTNWRRTRIILYLNGLSQMVGATFVASSPYFLVSAGMTATNVAMVVQIGVALGCVSMLITFVLLGYFTRRSIILVSISICAVVFLIMGVAGCFPHNSTALWIVGCTLQVAQFIGLGPAVGPAQAMAGEMSELRLRSKSQSIGFFFNYIFSTIWNVCVPYMFNQDEGNLGGKMGFIYLATCLIAIVVLFFELPETKDIPYQALDHLFEKKVPARKFRSAYSSSSNV